MRLWDRHTGVAIMSKSGNAGLQQWVSFPLPGCIQSLSDKQKKATLLCRDSCKTTADEEEKTIKGTPMKLNSPSPEYFEK